ncbi:MAG: bifunctional diguanylate cyclase/phosphodiesterase [Solirubrobacteraceae bacterium]
MERRRTGVLASLLLGSVIAGAVGGARALEVAGCAWGVLLQVVLIRRLRRERLPRSARALSMVFGAANGIWLVSDLLAVTHAVSPHAPFPTPVDGLALAGTAVFCVVITWVGILRGPWPDPSRHLEGVVFATALFAPLWFGIVEPQGAPVELVVWGGTTLVLLGFGATYIMGGGLWNLPAVLLALGVVGNVGISLGLHIAEAAGAVGPAATHGPQFGFGFVVWTFVGVHPRFADVFARGQSGGGIPLGARVWMLAPCVGLPLGVLAWSYVTGAALPIALVVGPLGVITGAIAILATIEWRRGSETWHVPLTISFTTLVAALAAVCITLAGQSTHRADRRADRLAETLPAIARLDAFVQRTSGRPGAADARARSAWSEAVAAAERTVGPPGRPLRRLLDAYTARAGTELATPGSRTAETDAETTRAYARLTETIQSRLQHERTAGAHAARGARLLMVGALLGALVAITLLLLRFSFAGRRIAVAYLERHDALTALPNRAAVELRLRRIAELGGGPGRAALVLLDLDDFKAVNDVHGHHVGDELLRAVAERLGAIVHGDELLARIDGDAFGVLVEGDAPTVDAESVAARMAAGLADPFDLAGGPLTASASIGIAVGGGPGDEAAPGEERSLVILRNAELAMYEAKKRPGISTATFEPSMHAAARDRMALTTDLRRAIEQEELHLVYQPIVDLTTGRALGYEALVRWDHPTLGPLAPGDFIPLAESTGLIVELGGWVLRAACIQLQTWQRGWRDRRYVSVNVAGQQLAAGCFPDQVRSALEASGLPADQLLLEVTESSLIENIDAAMQQMADVRALAARLALDDFGTGYSSLSYLRQFRVDVVKVDKSFIDDIIDIDGTSLVEAIVRMASSLRMKVIAEGIEADEQADVLRRLGCDLGQGFRFSRPLAAGDVEGAPLVFGLPGPALSPLRVAGTEHPRVA